MARATIGLRSRARKLLPPVIPVLTDDRRQSVDRSPLRLSALGHRPPTGHARVLPQQRSTRA